MSYAAPTPPDEKKETKPETVSLFLGDYSTSRNVSQPTGLTSKIYWLVVKDSEDMFRVKSMNEQNLPAGISRKLPVDEFMHIFAPEPDHFVEYTLPTLKLYLDENKDKVEVLDQMLEIGFTTSKNESTSEAIDRITKHLSERSKHLKIDQSRELSRYSVKLRKEKRYETAIEYCRKAINLNKADENIYFNMSRVYFEMDEKNMAMKCILYAIKLNESFEQALKFKQYMERNIIS